MKNKPQIEIESNFLEVRLVRRGNVVVASIPGVPKMSGAEVNEWIRRSRDRDV